MPYVKTVWVNGETKLNADNLNNVETGVNDALKGINSKQDKMSAITEDELNSILTMED